MVITTIRPEATGLSQVFWGGTREHRLLLQRCSACGQSWHPPAPLCPHCHSFETEWFPSTGRGHVYTFVVVRAAAHPLVERWLPYNVTLVALDEGPRIVSTVRGCPPEELRIGLRLELDFENLTGDLSLPIFRVARGIAANELSMSAAAPRER